ncbi:LacI family DNA-binding transcriptional regulator [Thalassobacillus sp. B23F22_16]|uniref:LacI family DNA-binding transcriptional regulator n=1 Tax=Thalassobacillus sp. B23F22_16 TaxID=3459513 RepID=UPI00373EE73B
MKKKVTMQDIADHLNISKNSVSQAFSGKPGVGEETKRQIFQVAEKLGYQYNKKSGHKPQSMGNIGLIASEFAFSMTSFFGEIYLTVEAEVRSKGKNLLIQSIKNEEKENLILPSFIENRQVDGILILSHISNEYIQSVLDTGIPTVLIDHHHPNIEADAILTNNRFGAYLATQHLAELGHKHIAFVGDTSFSPSYQERWEGYKLAMKEFGLEANTHLMFTDAKEEEFMINSFIQQLPIQPTAWFCVNDGLGYLVTNGLKQQGVHVPEEASVCSFDNGKLSQLSSPSITTIDIDLGLYGKKAVEKLFWRIENPEERYQETLLPAKLIKRQSTAEAPKPR